MVYGYARCSTNEDKQDISRQERELKAMGAKTIFYEYASGTDQNRIALQELHAQINDGDTIVATEISRITRSVHHLCHLIEWATEKHLRIRAGNFTLDCKKSLDPMAEGMALMMGVFAQLEQKTTASRIKSGVANARAKGKQLGRPQKTLQTLPESFKMHLEDYQGGKITVAEYSQLCGVSRHSIYRWLRMISKLVL